MMMRLFESEPLLSDMIRLMDLAKTLSTNGKPDAQNIERLGGGWVAEEALAIALYCCLKYPDDFSRAVTAAVNHCGDSDSTGAVTGYLLCASLGIRGIPEKFLRDLELKDVILEVAEDLYRESISADSAHRDREWTRKYGERSASL